MSDKPSSRSPAMSSQQTHKPVPDEVCDEDITRASKQCSDRVAHEYK